MKRERVNFAADHYAPPHPKVMEALVTACASDMQSYDKDPVTAEARRLFGIMFGQQAKVYLVAGGGTAANALCLGHLLRPYEGAVCSEVAHVAGDEAGAPEFFSRGHLIQLHSERAKLTVDAVKSVISRIGDIHVTQPRVLTLTQATERGTVYTPEEVEELAKFAHENNMYVHMDGARIFNAAAYLGVEVSRFTTEAGVDVVSVGGGKVGGTGNGEAVVFINPELAQGFENYRKQTGQLVSKMRILGAPWTALLKDGLALQLATDSNRMCQRLYVKIQANDKVVVPMMPETNGIWATLPAEAIRALHEDYFFYEWGDPANNEVRWMTSWNTTPENVDRFAGDINSAIKSSRRNL